MQDTMSLVDLTGFIRPNTNSRVTYNSLYRMTVDKDLPAEKNASKRWRVKEADLPAIVEIICDKYPQTHGV